MTDFVSVIQEEIVKVTGISESQLDVDTPFSGFGIESLQAVNISVNLSERLGQNVPVILFFNYPTIAQLAEYLAKGSPSLLENSSPKAAFEPVAIIGAACRFPGADSLEQFWYNQMFGVDSIRETPPDRWDWRAFPYSAMRWGGFLDSVDSFDENMFGLSKAESDRMDPQQKLLLHTTQAAIENSGLTTEQLRGSRTGVFIGISSSDYSLREKDTASVFDATGNAHSIAANRISYIFNLKGPSLSIDTACSSSLVAIHSACRSIQNRECDIAIVGGVNVILEPKLSLAFAEAGMLSPDGRCKTFSIGANGYVRGEGAGVVILQRMTDAPSERILAQILGSATNHDGKTNGLTAPNGLAQEEVIKEALNRANLTPGDIDFLEAHGTGTNLGDPVEFISLMQVFGQDRIKPLEVGAAKSFVGHLEAAAGICGLIKGALAVKTGKWPRQLHYQELNPQIPKGTALKVSTHPVERDPSKLRVGVSSFGFGGTNAHVILQSPPAANSEKKTINSSHPLILAFSATDPELLRDFSFLWQEALKGDEELARHLSLRSFAHRLQFSHRVALWGENRNELLDSLAAFQEGRKGRWITDQQSKGARPRLVVHAEKLNALMDEGHEPLAQNLRRFLFLRQEQVYSALHQFFPFHLRQVPEGTEPENIRQWREAKWLADKWAFVLSLADWGIEVSDLVGSGNEEIWLSLKEKTASPFEWAILAARRIKNDSLSSSNKVSKEGSQIETRHAPPTVNLYLGTKKETDEANRNSFWLSSFQNSEEIYGALAFLTLKGCRRTNFLPNDPTFPNTPYLKRKAKPMTENSLVTEFQALVADLLKVPKEEVGVDTNLVDLGADSLLMLMAIQSIKDRHGVTIAIPDVFRDLNTIQAIARFVESEKAKTNPISKSDSATKKPNGFDLEMPSPSSLIAELQSQNKEAVSASTTPKQIEKLIQQQLEIMRLQLSLLREKGLATEAVPPKLPEPSSENEVTSDIDGKGVLGLWRSRAIQERVVTQNFNFIDDFVKKFAERTRASKLHSQKFRSHLADNRLSAGFRPNLKEMIYTIVFRSGRGSRFVDLDGNQYVDLTMGFGVNLFGHSPDFIEERIKAQTKLGYCVGPQAELAGIVAEKACRVLQKERIAFLNSGTEAVMTALRLARAVTSREEVVIFEGSYHGHADVVLARTSNRGDSVPVAPGVPNSLVMGVKVLSYGTPESLDYIKRNGHRIAAVLVEPVQSRFPELQPISFLKELREATKSSGTAFIFDEVIFGLRASPSGAQGVFGIEPDLSVYGKILGGGLPIGAVAGHRKFLDPIDGGFWSFGDESYPSAEMTFFAGTFCKHPLAMAATEAVLDRMIESKGEIQKTLNDRTRAFCQELSAIINSFGVEVNHFSSLFRFKSRTNLDLFFAQLNYRGVYVWEGRNMFLSTTHSDADLKWVLGATKDSLQELESAGLMSSKELRPSIKKSSSFSDSKAQPWPLSHSQRRFLSLAKDPIRFPSSHIAVAFELKGPLDRTLLEKALMEVWMSSELPYLRVSLSKAHQWHDSKALPLPFSFEVVAEANLKRRLQEQFSQVFDLEKGPCLKVGLFQVKPGKTIFSLLAHHLPLDGWTVTRFLERSTDKYNEYKGGERKEHHPWRPSHSLYSWIHEQEVGTEAEKSRIFWHGQQFPAPALLSAPSGETKGHRVIYILNKRFYEKVKRNAKSQSVTPFLFLLNCFSRVLGKLLNRSNLQVSVPIALRDQEGGEYAMGNFVNLLPLSIEIVASFRDQLKAIKGQYFDKLPHIRIPLPEIEKIKKRDLSQVHFNFEPSVEEPKLVDLEFNFFPYPIDQVERPIIINVNDTKNTYYIELDFQFEALDFTQALRVFTEVERQINEQDRSLVDGLEK